MTAPPPPPPPPSRRQQTPRAPTTRSTPVASGAWSQGFTVVGRVKGALLVFTILALTAGSLFIGPLVRGTLREQGIEPTGLPKIYFDMPWLTAVLCIPALIAAIALMRGVARPFLWMTLSTLLLLPALAFFLLGAAGGVAMIYERAFEL